MSGFERIATDFSHEIFFKLLYVGDESELSASVCEAAQKSGLFKRVVMATARQGDLSEAEKAVFREELAIGTFDGCLIVVWDLDAICPDADYSIDLLDRAGYWSTQAVAFGVSRLPRPLTFFDFATLTSYEFGGVGSLEECLGTLLRWCNQPPSSGSASGLRAFFKKTPSSWIRDLKHDYLGSISRSKSRRLEETGLWQAQYDIDYWQNSLRNTLVFPDRNLPARLWKSHPLDPCDDSPLCLVVPGHLGQSFEALKYTEERDFICYNSTDELAELVNGMHARGIASLLVRDPELDVPEIEPLLEGASHLPSILVSGDSPRKTWWGWRQEFAANVLGGFSFKELMKGTKRSQEPIVELKRDYWRAFCFGTLPESVDHIRESMVQTYSELRGDLSDRMRRNLYSCIAESYAVRDHYFGPPPVTR